MKKIVLVLSMFLVLNACAVSNSKESIIPEEREREYYLKETKPYIEDILSEFDLINNENYEFAVDGAIDEEYTDLSAFSSNIEASNRRYRALKDKLISENIPTEGLREDHREKVDSFKKDMIYVCGKYEDASLILMQQIAVLGEDNLSIEGLILTMQEAQQIRNDSNYNLEIGLSELFSIEHDLDIKSDDKILPRYGL